MAPLPAQPDERPFHVHLTGFGPFGKHAVNPSWEAVKHLDGVVLSRSPDALDGSTPTASSSSSPHRQIKLSASLLPVSYTSCASLVPALHTPTSPPDLIIHVGVGLPGGVQLEQRARKWGYEQPDVHGQLCAKVEKGRRGHAGDGANKLRTSVDGEKVLRAVKEKGVEKIELSEDAGLYLCEFTYYLSLSTALSRNPSAPAPVQFVHVPPMGDTYWPAQLVHILKLVVWAIVNEGGLAS
ncbi:hypothetical protein JCM10213_004426 [Rhodosporidiobolus nylandii]